ncbi:MAG TPA: ABC transporter substrate-binding protein [Hyphomicrobiaceae bacterium]|nr:ABC transporter substrate-binding protein [Hyphomicrobiaceae bacterium]
MRRREFFVGLTVALGASTPAYPQKRDLRRVGILMGGPSPPLQTLREALQGLGYREGENISFEERFAQSSEERYPALAADLVEGRADVIVTWGTPATLAAKRATSRIPIVMAAIGDPVAIGLVETLSRPGGNVTGLSTLNAELESKRLEILKELVPGLARVGVLTNATSAYAIDAVQRLRRDAKKMGFSVEEVAVSDRTDLGTKLGVLTQRRPDGIVVVGDSFLSAHHHPIAQAMADNRLPAIYAYREAAVGGGLIAYGTDYHELFRRAAGYIDRIFEGAKPGDLPIEQPTRFQLVINLKSAKALGLPVSPTLLARADEVIE